MTVSVVRVLHYTYPSAERAAADMQRWTQSLDPDINGMPRGPKMDTVSVSVHDHDLIEMRP